MRRTSLGKFSANQLRIELNLTISKNIIINYLNASKILKYEEIEGSSSARTIKLPEFIGLKQCYQGEKVGPT